MNERDASFLDACRLIPRLLSGAEHVDSTLTVAGLLLEAPIMRRLNQVTAPERGALVPAALLLDGPGTLEPSECIAVLPPAKMSELVSSTKSLGRLEVAAIAFDVTPLADTAPYGAVEWRPRLREEIAELRAAGGVPFWVYGVSGAADAATALEAGVEAVVVSSAAGRHLGGPSVMEVLPEVVDAVAGTVAIYAGMGVRDGLDVFRLLATGADAVVVEEDRSLPGLVAELRYAMRLTGTASLAEIGLESVYAPLFAGGAE